MSQTVIFNQFIQYLKYEKEAYLIELEKELKDFPERSNIIANKKQDYISRQVEIIDFLSSTDSTSGGCFGLSLIHATMDLGKKLDWWKGLLVGINNWDGQAESLNKPVEIKNASIRQKIPLLKEIFDRALNYILSSHGNDQSFFPDIDQLNILQMDGYQATIPESKTHPERKAYHVSRSYFEALGSDAKEQISEIMRIKTYKILPGNLTKQMLMHDINEQMAESCILLFYGQAHVIRLGCHDGHWIVYDANYDHSDLTTMQKLGSKEECIDEVFNILENVSLIAASFEKNAILQFPAYNYTYNHLPLNLLENKGLWLISLAPEAEQLALLNQIDMFPENRKKLTLILAENLLDRDKDGDSLLSNFAIHAPKLLPHIIKRIDPSLEGQKLSSVINIGLVEPCGTNITLLHKFARNDPVMLEIVGQINTTFAGKMRLNTITTAFNCKTKKGWTLLSLLGTYSPNALSHLLKTIDDSAEGFAFKTALLTALCDTTLLGKRGFLFIEDERTLCEATKLAVKCHGGLQQIVNGLLPVWNNYSNSLKAKLIGILAREMHLQPLNVFQLVIYDEAEDIVANLFAECSRLDSLRYHPAYESIISTNGLEVLLNVLITKTDGKSRWQQTCEEVPEEMSLTLSAIEKQIGLLKSYELISIENKISSLFYFQNINFQITNKRKLFPVFNHDAKLYETILLMIQKSKNNFATKCPPNPKQ